MKRETVIWRPSPAEPATDSPVCIWWARGRGMTKERGREGGRGRGRGRGGVAAGGEVRGHWGSQTERERHCCGQAPCECAVHTLTAGDNLSCTERGMAA